MSHIATFLVITLKLVFLTFTWLQLSSSRDVGCDLFQGSWIPGAGPIYDISMCHFMTKQFDCAGNGRPDKLYLNYTWKPSNCKLPKFNGVDFLRRFQGKKILFVGDSLTLNHWESLACMLHASVPQSNYTIKRTGGISKFYMPEYRMSLMLSRNALLVDLVVDEKRGRILKLDSIKNGEFWKEFDMLVFNSWHWWVHEGRKTPWDHIEFGGKVHKDMDRLKAYELGLRTWSKWVDSNINPFQTRVFFQGISPTHNNATEWNAASPNGTTCHGETEPIHGSVYPGPELPAAAVVRRVLSNMTTAVQLLDTTTLSALRKDGHPSAYGIYRRGNDCSHWCLAGVPDTWNQLLYATLVADGNQLVPK
ncbi:protein trichome birefringence-like 41 [Salvia divinorum]|uniref:Protein trichome birefringence-like 41 n=1 Tax=Salvia divinorum TaxID=28513 RepID=A0ABD1G0P9_SALDI